MKHKKGQAGMGIAIFLAIFLALGGYAFVTGQLKNPFKKVGNLGGDLGDFTDATCDEDGQTALTLSVQNVLNTTGVETFDMGVRIIGGDGEIQAGTDTTSGSYTLNCPGDYVVKGLSASGASGDSAEFVSVVSGDAEAKDGDVVIRIRKAVQAVTIGGQQHGVLEARAFDVLNNGYAYNGDNNALDYETDGATFTGTTNGTALAIGAGGEFHYRFEYRPTVDDNVYGDIGGYLVLVDAATSVWNVPTMKINGVTYTNYKEQLSADEKIAYADMEYVYLAPSDKIRQTAQSVLDWQMFALSGVNPTADIALDFAARGAYASSTNSNLVKIGAVQDNTAKTVVHQNEDFNVDLS